ncbi:MAG: hypothetical protein U9N76_01020 [Candidatus Marinimicrobia bacterium]|nr:hypothetical protein [Candidatus Neomarinimicrobiota bacterium]
MNNKKTITTILLFGAIWGIIEATFGHLLHFLPTGLSGMIMFPIAFYFMFTAYKITDKQSAVFGVAIVASLIKLTDLFIPINSPMSAINPAVSIILESLIVFAFIKIYSEKRIYLKSTIVSLSWILLFIFSQKIIFQPVEGLYSQPIFMLITVIIMNAIVSGAILGTLLKFEQNPNFSHLKYNSNNRSFSMPIGIFIIAIVFEMGNSFIF